MGALTKGGAAAVLDFVGNEATYKFGDQCIRRGGKQLIVGLMGGKMDSPIPFFIFRSKTLQGLLVGNLQQAQDMLKLLRSGKVPVVPHHFRSIREVNNVFKDLSEGKYMGRCVLKHDWDGEGS